MRTPITFMKCLLACCGFILSMSHAKAAYLSGNYTIDSSRAASATNFKNFTSAAAYLTGSGSRTDGGVNNTAPFGVSGPVLFEVAAGTFTEQVLIGNIPGASAVSPVTFDGGAGNAATRILTYEATTSASRYTLRISNAQHVSIRNLTIRATGAAYGWALHMTGASSDYNKVKNCVVEVAGGGTTVLTNSHACIVISTTSIDGGVHANYLEIDSNTTNYGFHGISINGIYADKGVGNKFRGNIIRNAHQRGMNINTQNGVLIENNYISLRTAPHNTSSGIYCMGIETTAPERTIINGNRITNNVGTYGLYFNSCPNDVANKAIVTNNFIGGGHKINTGNSIYLTGSQNFFFAHNSLHFDAEGTGITHGPVYITSGCTGMSFINNIIANSKTGPAPVISAEESTIFDLLDNNLYYKGGINKTLMWLWGTPYSGTSFIGVGGFNLNPEVTLPGFVSDTNLHVSTTCRNGKDLSAYSSDAVLAAYLAKDFDGQPRSLASGDIGADEFIASAQDLAILSIVSPSFPAAAGMQDLQVSVRNNGSAPINTFTLTYVHNNGTPVQQTWNGTLNACESDTIVFTGADQVNITGQNTLTAYVALSGDLNLKNDTLTTTLFSGLNGNYTIGTSGADYASFTLAVNALKQRGITGPVTFTVAAGTYNEQVNLNEQIMGVSARDTIVFDGVSAASRIVTFAGAASARHTFLVGSNYVTLKNLTIRGTGGTYGWPVHITGSVLKNINVKKCVVEVTNLTSTSANYSCIVISGSATSATSGIRADSIGIDSNSTKGGAYGIICSGIDGNPGYGNQFRNNTVDSSANTSIYVQFQDGVNIDHNIITRRVAASSGEGIRLNGVTSNQHRTIVNGNIIRHQGGSGIYIDNGGHSANSKGICTNNMIGGNLKKPSTYGIQLSSSNYWYICHNTVLNDFPDGTSRDYSVFTANNSSNLTVLNNIFSVSVPSFSLPLYSNITSAFDTIDYNLYHRADTSNHELIYIGAPYNGNIQNPPQNVNSIVNPVRFVSNMNLRTTEACNRGIELSSLFTDTILLKLVSNDIYGNARTTSPGVGAYEYTPLATDLMVRGIVSPLSSVPFNAGSTDLVVEVQNNGSQTINSYTVTYNNNGTLVSELVNTPLIPCEKTMVTFTGTKQLNLSAPSNLSVYIELTGDQEHSNDTVRNTYIPALSGNYTIGGSGASYPSFTAAANALKQGGITSPVVFTVAPGTYFEQLLLDQQIRGASAINTITFEGVDSATRILEFSASVSAQRYTAWIASSYIRIKNLTIRASGSTYAWPVFISNTKTGVNNIEITKCVFDISSTNGQNPQNENYVGLVIGSSSTSASNGVKADSISIDSNRFNYGYYGIVSTGLFDMLDYSVDCRYRNNVFNTVAGGGINVSNHNNVWVEYNAITISKTSNFGSGISLSDCNTLGGRNIVKHNVVYNTGSGGSGISLYKCINALGVKGILANNVISGGFKGATGEGININQSTNWYVVHNSVNKDFAGGTTNDAGSAFRVNTFDVAPSNITVLNNIFSVSKNSASLPVYATGANLFDTLDYNIYYKADTSSSGEILNINATSYSVLNFVNSGGYNAHSLFRVPGFINDTNLHMPLQNSCANRSGFTITDSALAYHTGQDIDGQARMHTPLIGADELPAPHQNDLSVTRLVSPSSPFSAGLNDVKVLLTNTGSQPILSATIHYTINNDPPSVAYWSGTLNQCDTAVLTFPVQVVFNQGANQINLYSHYPNGILDENFSNDTLEITLLTAMEGTYTIGSDPADSFPNFTSAILALNTRGVGAAVDFKIRTGIYNEYIELNAIPGASSTNTITFEARHRDSVYVQYSSTGLHPNLLTLSGASHISFKNLSFIQQNTANYNAVYLTGACSYDTFANCRISAMTPTSNLNYSVYGIDLTGAGLSFINNSITGGGGGVFLRGISSSLLYKNLTFIKNDVHTTFFATLDLQFHDSLLFANNFVTISGARVNNNSYLLNCNNSLFANNVVIGSDFVTQPQIQVFGSSTNSHVYHNSFNLKNDNGAGAYIMNSPAGSLTVKNNTFTSRGSSYAATFVSIPLSSMVADHNHYYATGDLIRTATSTYSNIFTWKAASAYEKHSVSYLPAYSSPYDLMPVATDSASWAFNGRAAHSDTLVPFGQYLKYDITGAARPLTFADGTPDIGAYEFTPTAIPPAAIAVPLNPIAGSEQMFTFAGDTIAKLTWDPVQPVPATLILRQYSGEKPPATGTAVNYMHFYVEAQVAAGTYYYQAEFPYQEGWRGTLPSEADARLTAYDPNLSWQLQSSSTVEPVSNKFAGTFTKDWAYFTGTDLNDPLPVKWLSFNGSKVQQHVVLNWTTASERNNKGFEVQRSTDGKTFEAIGFVKGNGTTGSISTYSFTDVDANGAKQDLYYRLKQLDQNNAFSYSSTVIISNSNTSNQATVFPNPFSNEISISLGSFAAATAHVEIRDVQGKLVKNYVLNNQQQNNTLNITDLNDLENGVYFLTISSGNEHVVTKVVKAN